MALGTSSRAVWATSKFAYTQRYLALSLSVSARGLRMEVFPVWRGAYSTKYRISSTSSRISSRLTRLSGGMQ